MKFSSVEREGSVIPPETPDEIVLGEAPGQKPQDFGLSKKTDLDNEIAASWSDARGYWASFQAALDKLEKDKSSVSLTRDLWMLPLLRCYMDPKSIYLIRRSRRIYIKFHERRL